MYHNRHVKIILKSAAVYMAAALALLPVTAASSGDEFVKSYYRDTFDTVKEYPFDNSGAAFTVEFDYEKGAAAPCRKLSSGRRMIAQKDELKGKTEGIVSAQTDFYFENCVSSENRVLNIYNYDGNIPGGEITRERNYLYFSGYNAAGESLRAVLGEYEPCEWINISYSVNIASKEIKIYLNGRRIFSDERMYVNPQLNNIGRVFCIDNRNSSETIYIDNLFIYEDTLAENIPFDDMYDVTENITLPETDSLGRSLTWEIEEPEVVAADGTVIPKQEDTAVAIKAFCGGQQGQYRTYYIDVCGGVLSNLKDHIDFAAEETFGEPIVLPRFTKELMPIVWSSGNEQIIDSAGNVTRPAKDTQVVLTAVAAETSAQYTVNVIGYENEMGIYCISKSFIDTAEGKRYQIKIYNGEAKKNVNIILAVYDENKLLKKVKQFEHCVNSGENVLEGEFDISGAQYKAFIWSGGEIMPETKSASLAGNTPGHIYIAAGGGAICGRTAFDTEYSDMENNVLVTSAANDNWRGTNTSAIYAPSGVLMELGRLTAEKYGDVCGIMDCTVNSSGFGSAYLQTVVERITDEAAKGALFDGLIIAPCENLLDRTEEKENALTPPQIAEFVYAVRRAAGNMSMPVVVCMPAEAKSMYAPIMQSCTSIIENCTAAGLMGLETQDGINLTAAGAKAFGKNIFDIFCGNN